ncbi:hypothetical protein CUJ83_09135 [Methanocella sp. CWC-04]|uniref:Uncharacterized protein n=1 Tax=Methanooceanicella nereidis TaxID=2052831 RepID=A0AAP2REP2_9EURY|nr:hypothetical protein [Methanocella sp. CWC-04]MCD1295160.1 hypothetical protein [Methanocella sp. CWC-04]
MSNANIKFIEVGLSFLVLLIFIASMALAKDIFGESANIAYVAILLAFTVIMCFIGFKVASKSY